MQFNLKAAIVRDPLVVSPDTTVQAAIAQMSDTCAFCTPSSISDRPLKNFFEDGCYADVCHAARSSCLLVVVADRLVGMLTTRDVVRLSAQQQDLRNLPVAKVMTRSIISCREADFTDPFMAAKLFKQHRIRHLPILDDGDRPVGVLTHESLAQAVLPPHLLRSQLVATVMTEPAICIPSDVSMLAIAQLMAECGVGEVAIGQTQSSDRGHQRNPIGIVTERDVVQLQALGIDLATCPGQSVMDTRMVAVQPEDSLATVQQTLEQHHIQQLMVMGDEGAWLGTVTQSSLLQLLDPLQLWQVAAALGQRVAQLESEKPNFKPGTRSPWSSRHKHTPQHRKQKQHRKS
ncbi:MAG: CBS domain-containing protein [Coleofasciculaceae cyanobacterium SM2_3_26]|nr:CBS domain-containing protein [Coleofasciculaceae cyanobacterium SM2_3_26]